MAPQSAKQLDLVLRNRIAEKNQRNLDRINAALQRTLEELAMVEVLEAQTPGAYTSTLNKLRAKRDRQHANATSTAAFIAALRATK